MDFMIGQLLLLPTTFAPTGTLQCNGQTLQIQQYVPLFQAIGTTFGGDGQSTFALPVLAPVATTQGVSVNWFIVWDGVGYEQGSWAYLGQVMPMAVPPPAGTPIAQQWVPCDGRLLSPGSNQALFALVGTQFGGNGTSTFAVPNLPPLLQPPTSPSGGAPVPYYICTDGLFPDSTCNAVSPSPGGDGAMDAYLSQIYQLPYLPDIASGLCGFGLCAGQELTLAQGAWDALFSLVGTQFGGNGQNTFALPNIPTGANHITYVIATSGVYPSRD